MRTFLEFLKAMAEYNTTGEVDGENNTDLEKPNPSIATQSTRWYAQKKKGPIRSKYVAMMKKMKESEEWEDEEPEEELRPGMPTKDGGHHEPEHEPDLGEFIANRFRQDYGETTDEITPETGYLLSDGRCVPMGAYGSRYEDHRAAIPSLEAMKRWKWNPETIRQYETASRGPALDELIKRSGAARIHASRDTLAVDSARLTYRQKSAIVEFIMRYHPATVIFDLNGRSKEFDSPEPFEIEDWLSRR